KPILLVPYLGVGSSTVEQRPFKSLVPGSNPGQPTIKFYSHSPTSVIAGRRPSMKRLVIVEDQTAIREMLVEILRLDANYQLVGESGDGQSALALCLEVKPDLLVLDAKLPGLNGVDLLRRVSKKLPDMRVLVFSGHENPVLIREMLESGAHGFVEKTAGLFEFKKGLETVAHGGTYFGPEIGRASCRG